MKKLASTTAVLAVPAFLAMLSPRLHAVPLVYESYDGYAAGTLAGKAATGTGLTGDYGGSGTGHVITAQGNGLLFGTLSTNAQGRALSINTTNGQTSAAALASGISVSGRLYASYLINLTAFGGSSTFAEARVVDAADAAGGASRFRTLGEGRSPTAGEMAVGYNSTDNVDGNGAITAGTTYLVIGRYDNLGTSGITGTATGWVLSEAQYTFFNTDGTIADSELEGAPVGTGADQVTSTASHTATTASSATFQTGDFVQFATLGATTSGNTVTGRYDELRYGTTLDDVTQVPEPSCAILATLAGGALVGRRRRRS